MVTDIPARRPYEPLEPGGWQKFLARIQPYQNIIFFVLLIISLVILLIFWRGYRYRQKNLQAWEQMFAAQPTADNFQNLAQLYGDTEIAPVIHYRLGNAYYNNSQYAQAKTEYQYFLNHYPVHPLKSLVELRLKDVETNEQWQKGDEKRNLAELKARLNLPQATVKTNRGDFEVELYEEDAPNTVAHFISLVERGVYSQTPFSEINPDLGLCLGTNGYPFYYTIKFEKNNLKNLEGSLGMIRNLDPEPATGGDSEREEFLTSAGSRFYVSLRNNPVIDDKYTVFGKVSKGMEVVRQLNKGDEIRSVVITKKREHEYKPEVIKQPPKPEHGPPSPP